MRAGYRRAKCKACEAGCVGLTAATKAKRHRESVKRGSQRLQCEQCLMAWERPITRGRPPKRCPDCLANPIPVRGFRGHIVLGPCRCLGCGELLTWNGWAWDDATGVRHVCTGGTMMSATGRLASVANPPLRPVALIEG